MFKRSNAGTLERLNAETEEVTMSAKNFEDLEIWQLARSLTGKIYKLTRDSGFAKDFGLCSQIQRASVSVMSNIAEGYERGGNQEFIQFLAIAKGSGGEVRCQLYVALDQGYVKRDEAEALIDQHKKLSIMIHKFMEHLKGSNFKGQKYKPPKPDPKMTEFDALLQSYLKK
jgi:four helix bundle protein